MTATIDQLRAAQRWLVRIHDEATALMDWAPNEHTAAGFSRLRQMALEGLDNPMADRLDRMREGLTKEGEANVSAQQETRAKDSDRR